MMFLRLLQRSRGAASFKRFAVIGSLTLTLSGCAMTFDATDPEAVATVLKDTGSAKSFAGYVICDGRCCTAGRSEQERQKRRAP